MFEKLDPKEENSKNENNVSNEKANNFSLPGLSDNQINRFSSETINRIAPPPPALTDFSKRMTDLEAKGKKRGRRNMFIGTIGGAIIALIVMCFVYYISKDVSNISSRIDQDVNEMLDLSNRKKGQKIIPTDTDNDGLPDEDEIKYKTDPNNPDTDGDGFLDSDEIKRGFNPNGEGLLNEDN